MIGSIFGKIILIAEEYIILQTPSGVGYNVFCPTNVLANCSLGGEKTLFTVTAVKEESITIFGFNTYKDVIWFKSLTKVSGVGAKIANLILSSFKINEIIFAIENEQKSFFTSVAGIGEKLAVRIISELKKEPKKNTAILTSTLIEGTSMTEAEEKTSSPQNEAINDAVLTLEALGFSRSISYSTCIAILHEKPEVTTSDLVKQALKTMNKG